MQRPRIVYVQYTNPAGYPPLQHSSRILANAGWDVLFLGAGAEGADRLAFPEHPRIEVRRWSRGSAPGLRQKINFGGYLAWVARVCRAWQPDWIYASDPLSCPAALAGRAVSRARLLYHEHDAPPAESASLLSKVIAAARKKVGRTADLCVVPHKQRLALYVAEVERTGDTECVWNCPAKEEIRDRREPLAGGDPVTFYFHGSLSEVRLPFGVLEALSLLGGRARFVFAGYETIGSRGFVREFMRQAAQHGLGHLVTYLGEIPQREELLDVAARADVGLSFMPLGARDLNMAHMAGASNKPFDYLACGQFLLVSDLPEWRDMFVGPGYGRACSPYDANALSEAMRWCVDHPQAVRAGGEAGRRRVAADWNYETMFAPVAERLSRGASVPVSRHAA